MDNNNFDTVIQSLASMNPITYALNRATVAKNLGVPESAVNQAVMEEKRKKQPPKKKGTKEKEDSPQLCFSRDLLKTGNYKTKDGTLYHWTGTHWNAMTQSDIDRLAIRYLEQGFPDRCNEKVSASCSATTIQRAESLPDVVNAKYSIIPVQNGYLYVGNDGSIELRPHDADLGLTYCLACDYNPVASSPLFDAFIEEALPDEEVRNYLREYSGYTLTADARYQYACWLIGGGGNGKSTAANVLQALHRKPVSVNLDALDGFNLIEIVGASLVYCDETPVRIDEQRLKTLVSGGSVQIERKYLASITLRPTAKWLISGNAMPSISDHTDGFWRRWAIIPFDTKPKVVQPELDTVIIETELSGVLNWALAGLIPLLARGKPSPKPKAILDAQESGKQQSNSVKAWLSDSEAFVNETVCIGKKEAYNFYSNWCRQNGMRSVSSQKFWERIEMDFGDKLKSSRKRFGSDCNPIWAINLGFGNSEANEMPVKLPNGDYASQSQGF